MEQIPLIGGAYSARSNIANCQRCVNLFPEINRKDSPTQMTHYQRPGLVPLVSPSTTGVGRGFYEASNGDGYIVVGTTLYLVDQSFTLWSMGSISSVTVSSTSIVSMVDNGSQLMIVAGSLGAGNATGTVTWGVNPSNGDTVTLNGVVWTFKTTPVSATDIQIAGTLAVTITNLRVALIASTNPLITVAYYNSSAGVLKITSSYSGALGASYTLAASVGVPSAAHLTIGTIFPSAGWRVDLGDLTGATFTAITDAAWTGANTVSFLDTFIVWNVPGTVDFASTLSDQIEPMDATYIAGKTSWSDPLVGLSICQEQILLLGTHKSEIWYNAGNAGFPFSRQQGTAIQHGCESYASIATADLDIFWLAANLQGKGVVLKLRGNDVKRISNFALEYAMSQMSTISDAVGYTYMQAGHVFYVISFPTANQTWVWDASVGDPELGWHQRGWTDTNGTINRDRGVVGGTLFGKVVALDWENGTLYEQSQTTYTDTIQTISGGITTSQSYPITYLRSFPHVMAGKDPNSGQLTPSNGRMVKHERFMIDAETGGADSNVDAKFIVRYSDDRGKTWSGKVELSAGKQGEFDARPDLSGVGMAMDRVYEVSWSFSGKVALNGAWTDGTVLPR